MYACICVYVRVCVYMCVGGYVQVSVYMAYVYMYV